MNEESSMRFLVVLPTAILGGAERVMFNLALYLLDSGHSVTIYCMSRGRQPGWERIEGYEKCTLLFREYPSEKKSLVSFLYNIFSMSRQFDYDYVFSSHTHINGLLSLFLKLRVLKCRYLISRESTFIFDRFFGFKRMVFYFLYRFFYGSQSLLICQTEGMKHSLLRNLNFSPVKNIKVIGNPVDLNYISERAQGGAVSLVDSSIKIVSCGRLVPVKAFDVLIEAYAKSLTFFSNTHLYIIGDGVEHERLRLLINSLDLNERVTMLGRLENPMPWFAIADIGIVSSEREGFPNVLIEMMASGTKRVITTPCSDGVFGIPGVVVSNDCSAESLSEKIFNILNDFDDKSLIYKGYVRESRSVEGFWLEVKSALN